MSNTIEGTWHSRYEYGQGPGDIPQTSEHTIEFMRDHNSGGWVGFSQPDEKLTITIYPVLEDSNEFRGEWNEVTSPTGHYRGRELGGTILLLLQAEGAELNGMWLGANSDQSRVKSGAWNLKREESQAALISGQ